MNDAEEFAPEFAKRVEPTEVHREAELVLSPSPVEDIWDRGHPNENIMWLRGRYFWLVELLRNYPNQKYFVFDPSWTAPKYRSVNPLTFRMKDYPDWDYYRSSADMIRHAISLWNQYLFDWMRGKYDPNEAITDEQVDITIKIIECLGGVLGILPMMRPNIQNEKRERLVYLMNEKLKRDHEEKKRDKLEALRNRLEPIRNTQFRFPTLDEQVRAYSTNDQEALAIHEKIFESHERVKRQRTELRAQIQSLEYSQPHQYTSLPSSITSLKNLDEIKTVAIQAGMPSHEVEEFIEWELNPFTSEEKEAVINYIKFTDRLVNYLEKHEEDAPNKYWNEHKKVVQQFFDVTIDRRNVCEMLFQTRHIRSIWQNHELGGSFFRLFFGDNKMFIEDPIKVPSGKYVETLRVERTQQDLNNDMVSELLTLPRRHAYVKIMQETGVVATHKITTKELPPPKESDIETLVRLAGYDFCKKREDIRAEIRERQSRWQGGSGPPSQAKRIR